METIINSLQCWWREKEEVVKKPHTPPPDITIQKDTILKDIYCSCCFRFIENENLLFKKAKIGPRVFGFCCDECYLEWLKSPSTMLFGKIN